MGETLTMKRILVADHSEIANRMFCAGLSKYGFSVSAVSTTVRWTRSIISENFARKCI